MSFKPYYVSIDLNKESLLNAKLNPLSSTEQTTLAATLGVTELGLVSWNTTTNTLMLWNSTSFVNAVPTVAGAMTYKGATSSLTTIPTTIAIGDTYVYTGAAGNLTWSGVTFSPSAAVEPGDMLVFRTATSVDVVQGNNVQATETVTGIAKVATQTQTNTGTDDTTIITPLKLEQKLINRATPKAFISTGLTLVANTALTISFPTTASHKDAFMVSLKDSTGSEFTIDVDAVNTSGFTITSSIALTGVTAFVTYL